MALGAHDVQAAGCNDRVVAHLPLGAKLVDLRFLVRGWQRFIFAQDQDLRLDGAAEHDVRAATRHVGRDGNHLRPPRLRDDLRLARVLLGVEYLMRQLLLLQDSRKEL